MTFQAATGQVFAKKGSCPTLKSGLLWYNSAIFPVRIPVRLGPLSRGNFRGLCLNCFPACQELVGVHSCRDCERTRKRGQESILLIRICGQNS